MVEQFVDAGGFIYFEIEKNWRSKENPLGRNESREVAGGAIGASVADRAGDESEINK